jgi:hypothetical protein
MSDIAEVLTSQNALETVPKANNDGGQPTETQKSAGWLAAVSEDIRNHEALKEFKNSNEAAHAYVKLHELSKQSIVKPGDKATQAELDAYHKALGRPEKPEDYELPEGYKEFDKSGNFQKWVRDTAHKHNLSKSQAEAYLADQLEYLNGLTKAGQEQKAKQAETEKVAYEKSKVETDAELTKRWGKEADSKKKAAMAWFEKQNFPAEKIQRLMDQGLLLDPDYIEYAANQGSRMLEGGFVGGDGQVNKKPAYTLAKSSERLTG